MIKLSIIDDHPLILEGLKKMLEHKPNIELLGAYLEEQSLLSALEAEQPDILLMDVFLPHVDTAQLLKMILSAYPEMKIIMLTNSEQLFTIRSMFADGAYGYILKGIDRYGLVEALETVKKGDRYLDPMLRNLVLNDTLTARQDLKITLTQREQILLESIAAEMTNKQIAEKMFMSEKRVQAIKTDLFIKLSVKNGAGLVRKGMELGLIK